jgi:hypothetical protein
MYPAKPGLVIGFHGCDLSLCNNLVQGKTRLEPSINSYDWLGNGIYFWENNKQRALNFVTDLKNARGRNTWIKRPAVVGAILDLGYCLDLLDAEFIDLVKESYKSLLLSCNKFDIPIPENRNVGNSKDLLLRELDCAVIRNLHFQRELHDLKLFDSIRAAFIEGNPLYNNAGFYEKTHIQLCICNPNCIKGYFLPRESNDNYPVP